MTSKIPYSFSAWDKILSIIPTCCCCFNSDCWVECDCCCKLWACPSCWGDCWALLGSESVAEDCSESLLSGERTACSWLCLSLLRTSEGEEELRVSSFGDASSCVARSCVFSGVWAPNFWGNHENGDDWPEKAMCCNENKNVSKDQCTLNGRNILSDIH